MVNRVTFRFTGTSEAYHIHVGERRLVVRCTDEEDKEIAPGEGDSLHSCSRANKREYISHTRDRRDASRFGQKASPA